MSLYYRQELSVTLSIGLKSPFAMYPRRPFANRPFFTSNWLCSKLLVIYPDRGGQAKHFWHFLFLLSFLSQLSSAQLRDISAKFYSNNFYSPWPPLTDKTLKKNCVSSYCTSALGSTVNNEYSVSKKIGIWRSVGGVNFYISIFYICSVISRNINLWL